MIDRLIIAATDGRVPHGFVRLDGSKCTSTEPVPDAELPYWLRVLESTLTQLRLRKESRVPVALEAVPEPTGPLTPTLEDTEL